MRLPETVADGRRWLLSALAATVGVLGVLVVTANGDDPPAPPSASPADAASPAPSCAGALEASTELAGAGAEGAVARHPAAGPPVQVDLDAIDVRAAVVPVVLSGTVLVPPRDVEVVGWWADGAEAGARRGTVLLSGHSVHAGDGVFDRLGELRVGDRVRVGTARGTVTYEVSSVTAYDRESLADQAATLFDLRGAPRLALATCSGFDGQAYTETTVVLADPAG